MDVNVCVRDGQRTLRSNTPWGLRSNKALYGYLAAVALLIGGLHLTGGYNFLPLKQLNQILAYKTDNCSILF